MRKEFQQKLGNINKTQEDFDMAVIKNFDEIVERVKGFPKPMRVIVAAAQDEHTLQAIKHAQEEGIAKPVLVGDKAEINKIVADITNNKGQLVKYKINVDDNGQATKALLTYRNELNEVTNATLKLKSVGKWYDANGMEHNIVKWSEGQKTLSQNIEATTKANHRQTESDNQVIRKKEELIAKMKLLNTQAEKAGISLNSDNQNKFNDLSIKASTVDDIKQLETYFRLARTERVKETQNLNCCNFSSL